jgi:hypothetical protein
LAAPQVSAPLEIALNYPVEVNGVVHDSLVVRNQVRSMRRHRGKGTLIRLAHLFNVSPAVIGELDEADLEHVSNRLEEYASSMEG